MRTKVELWMVLIVAVAVSGGYLLGRTQPSDGAVESDSKEAVVSQSESAPAPAPTSAASMPVDAAELTHEGRNVMLFGPIEPSSAQSAITRLLALAAESKTRPIRVYVNSPGGTADDAFAIYDVMKFVDWS